MLSSAKAVQGLRVIGQGWLANSAMMNNGITVFMQACFSAAFT